MSATDVTTRRFVLRRVDDVSGTSGTGIVAEGVEFSNGQVALHWLSQLDSVAIYGCAKVLESIHGHEGRTTIEWLDCPQHNCAIADDRDVVQPAVEITRML